MSICTFYDEYLQDKDKPVWIAVLSDETVVYGDDGRYGEEDRAWFRLKAHLKAKNLKIEQLRVKFRSHVEVSHQRTENTRGWFLSYGAGAFVGQPTFNYILTGVVEGDTMKVKKWRVPEVLLDEEETRGLVDDERVLLEC